MTVLPSDEAAETPFYIPATGPSTRPRRTLKHDDIFAVFDSFGDIGATAGAPDGNLFQRHALSFAARNVAQRHATAAARLQHPRRQHAAFRRSDQPRHLFREPVAAAKDTIHIVRTVFLWQGTAYQRIALRNHGERAIGVNCR